MDDHENWPQVAEGIYSALADIDQALSELNTSLSDRKIKAFDLIMKHLVEVQGDYKEFIVSEAYARIMALVDNWYLSRYGEAFRTDKEHFHSLIVIHGTTFPLLVPRDFTTPGEAEGTVWVGFPASVQKEENPLEWIVNCPSQMSESERSALREKATQTASSIRSITFDLKTVQHGDNDAHRKLASSALANLRGGAQKLCGKDDGLLREAGWELCQAVEKTLKLYIRRYGGSPGRSHVLAKLADHAQRTHPIDIDRDALSLVPSGKMAINLRYEGTYSIGEGIRAYDAALEIIKKLAFAAQIKSGYNVREARFLLRTPPWFRYDTEAFLKTLPRGKTEECN